MCLCTQCSQRAWHKHTLRPHACMHTCYVRARTIVVCMRTHLCYVSAQVTAQGHTTTLKPGQCSPQMMRGEPYIHQAPRFFHTTPGKIKVHWDGRVWCP